VSAPSTFPFAPVGKAAAITIVMGMCIAVIPFVPPLILPFLALPAAHLVARWGVLSGAIVAVVAGALVYVGAGISPATLVFFLVVAMGGTLGWAVRARWSFERSLAVVAGAALLALVLWGLVMWLALGVDLTWLRQTAYEGIDDAAARYVQMGLSASSANALSGEMHDLIDIVPYLTPGLLGMGVILLAACSLGLAYWLFPRVRQKVTVALSLSRFRMHWAVAYVSIVGLALILFARGDSQRSAVMLYVGINMLLVSQTLFFLQGLAVARWFAVSRKMGRRARRVMYAAAVILQLVCQLTGLVGLFDTWIDYRKRYTPKSPDAGSAS
jgi:uncharacterized protein YybS (DUF2232 family)